MTGTFAVLVLLLLNVPRSAAAAAVVAAAVAAHPDEVNPLLGAGSVSIQADVYYGDESEERVPIARTKFYLLDASFVQILKRADFVPEDAAGEKLGTDAAYLEAAAGAFFNFEADENNALVGLLIDRLIEKHRAALLVTNGDGTAKIRTMPTGDYFLYAAAVIDETEREVFVWHLPVRVTANANTALTLDQDNAESVFAR